MALIVTFMVVTALSSFFFFQAEDGIRDRNVTGVQTCALPICRTVLWSLRTRPRVDLRIAGRRAAPLATAREHDAASHRGRRWLAGPAMERRRLVCLRRAQCRACRVRAVERRSCHRRRLVRPDRLATAARSRIAKTPIDLIRDRRERHDESNTSEAR